MDNIGPIALFIIYMAISAWAKKNKAQRRAAQDDPAKREPDEQESFMGGIFERLKQELVEANEEPVIIPFEEQVDETQPEPEPEPVIERPTAKFHEGSDSLSHSYEVTELSSPYNNEQMQTLDSVLEPYSRIEQGILLHEILGKPRAYQKDDEWFHRS